MEPTIIFEDENLLVVSKPAGVVVNKADSAKNNKTLQEWVDERIDVRNVKTKKSPKEYVVDGYNKYDEFVSRSGIVHRLDKETSGILLIAKNPETFINLQDQFKTGKVHKTYLTLVHGKVEKKEGSIDAPIGRLPWNRMRFGIYPEGRQAISNYKVIEYKKNKDQKEEEDMTLVEVYPQTGRTHQIRVHFQHIKHPVFGDELYAGRKTGKKDRRSLQRHFLHASKIELEYPESKQVIYESELPEELSQFYSSLE